MCREALLQLLERAEIRQRSVQSSLERVAMSFLFVPLSRYRLGALFYSTPTGILLLLRPVGLQTELLKRAPNESDLVITLDELILKCDLEILAYFDLVFKVFGHTVSFLEGQLESPLQGVVRKR
jgi:hypothetical protein